MKIFIVSAMFLATALVAATAFGMPAGQRILLVFPAFQLPLAHIQLAQANPCVNNVCR